MATGLAAVVKSMVLNNKMKDLKRLLDSYSAEERKKLINFPLPSCRGRTSVHLAAGNDLYDCLELLLRNGGNPNAKSSPPDSSQTPLHLAAKRDHSECAWLLLNYRANPQMKDEDKHTASYYMASKHKCKKVWKEYNELMSQEHKPSQNQAKKLGSEHSNKKIKCPRLKQSPSQPQAPPNQEKTLSSSDHHEIAHFLDDLNKGQLHNLGLALGLHSPKLQRMRDLPGDMVTAWLREDDNVSRNSGHPCWVSLVRALEEVGHSGIAAKIRQSKFSARRNSDEQNEKEHINSVNSRATVSCSHQSSTERDRLPPPTRKETSQDINKLPPSPKTDKVLPPDLLSPTKREEPPLPTKKDEPPPPTKRDEPPPPTKRDEPPPPTKRDEPSPKVPPVSPEKEEKKKVGALEYLKKHRTKVEKAATLDMTWLAHEMNANGLLSDPTHRDVTDSRSVLSKDQKANEMIGELLTFVDINSRNLHKFVELIRKKTIYADIVELLVGSHSPLRNESYNTNDEKEESRTKSKAGNCLAKNITSSQYVGVSHAPQTQEVRGAHEKIDHEAILQITKKLTPASRAWKEIGTCVGFTAKELSLIESKLSDMKEDPKGCLHEMLSQWQQWAPGDARGNSEYVTMEAMKNAVDRAGFGYLAREL